MDQLLADYGSVLVDDHYARWVFQEQGLFQVTGWGCSAGMMNHDEFVRARIGSTLCEDEPGRYSYVNAVTDTDWWIAARVAEVVAAHRADPEWPLINNFMDGANGWYRVNLEAGSGYGPNDLTRVLVDGGYGVWSLHNPDIGALEDRLWELIEATWVQDASGNGRVASQTGGTWTSEGAVGGAILLEGDGRVDLGADEAWASSEGSVELWFSQGEGATGDGDLLNVWENGYYDFLLIRRLADGGVLVYIEDEDAPLLSVGTDAGLVEEGAWRHLVVTQDGSAPHVFLDGSEVPLQGTSTGAWTGHLQSPGAWFGNSHWSPHVGGLDELRIYDRALSSGEVAAHYAGTFDDDSGLLGHWSFDEETDIEAGAFLAEHYASSFSPRDSLELMQFLPGFVEPGG